MIISREHRSNDGRRRGKKVLYEPKKGLRVP